MTKFITQSPQDYISWFHSFYTKENRLGLHIMMWLLYAGILEAGLLLNYDVSFTTSLFIIFDSLSGNFIIFYPFFYLIYPYLIKERKILLSIVSIIGLILLWRANGYLNTLLIAQLTYVDDTLLRGKFNSALQSGFLNVFSFRKVFGGLIDIIYSLSPVFCIKVIVEMLKAAYKTTEIEKEKIAIEISYLKSQLNPHFLFNTLNSIYILDMKEDESAGDVILELSDTLRYTLYESNREKVLLRQEVDFLHNYVNLERVRLAKDTSIVINCNFSGMESLTISPLLMFPFLENAFKHGLGQSMQNPWLEINMRVVGSLFHFDIKNSKEEEMQNSNQLKEYFGGIGVANTKKRLAILYPGKHVLEIDNTAKCYHINLKIKL